MESFELELRSRDKSGSAACRRYRKEGLIPSVVYTHGKIGHSVLVPEREFVRLARLARSSQIFSFKSEVPELNGVSAIVKNIQRQFLSGSVLHVDFHSFREDEEISVKVGLKFVGEATGVKLDGGILAIASHEVTVRCLPKALPQEIAVDVSELGMGNSLHVRDLKLPDGVKIEGNPDETVVAVVAVHVTVEETAAPAEGAAVEGAAPVEGAPAAAAAAPAAGEKKEGEKPAK